MRFPRFSRVAVLDCFAYNLPISTTLYAELFGVILAIGIVVHRGWNKLWIEIDCLLLTKDMQFTFYHINREGNCCADKLASFGVANHGLTWWDLIPFFY